MTDGPVTPVAEPPQSGLDRSRLFRLEQWRKNQIAATISIAFLFFGSWLVMPFLPIYVRDLGIQSTNAIAFWSGLILSVTSLISALAGPLWGRLGDRIGMKLMAQRATIANCVCWFLMGFSHNVYQLFILRALLGLFGGFSTVSVALATQLSPKDKVAGVIGTLQSVQILSAAIGPFFGGLLADSIGIRRTFFVTAIVMLGSVVSMTLLYQNTDNNKVDQQKESAKPNNKQFLKRPEYLTTMLILFFVNMADRTFGPILPLFLEQLGTPASRLAAVSGTLISIAAFGEAFSAWLSGKLASRITLRKLILWRLVFSVLVLLPMIVVRSSEQFSVLRVLLALLAGGTLTLALTAANDIIPGESRGAGYSILSGTSILGGAIGPLIAGSIASFGLSSIFVFNSIVYVLMMVFVFRYVRH
jgi:DHA1 family multidrug resistance protein-like MFS transporter